METQKEETRVTKHPVTSISETKQRYLSKKFPQETRDNQTVQTEL